MSNIAFGEFQSEGHRTDSPDLLRGSGSIPALHDQHSLWSHPVASDAADQVCRQASGLLNGNITLPAWPWFPNSDPLSRVGQVSPRLASASRPPPGDRAESLCGPSRGNGKADLGGLTASVARASIQPRCLGGVLTVPCQLRGNGFQRSRASTHYS